MERIVNRNKFLFGPGPLARKATGLGAKPPLEGLVTCAIQGTVVSLIAGGVYVVAIGNPGIQAIEDYYKENPSR